MLGRFLVLMVGQSRSGTSQRHERLGMMNPFFYRCVLHLFLGRKALLPCLLLLIPVKVSAYELLSFSNFAQTVTITPHGERYKIIESGEEVVLSDRLIVKTEPQLDKSDLLALSPKILSVREIFIADTFTYFSVRVTHQADLSRVSEQLKSHRRVLFVQPDLLQLRHPLSGEKASTKHISLLERRKIYSGYLKKIGVPTLQTQTHGKGVTIAVIDDGFLFRHPALKHKSPRFAYDLDSLTMSAQAASLGGRHGTMVASILFARPDEEIAGGIAPEADFIALRHTNTWTSKIVLSFQLANLAGADIINCSWRSRWLTEPVADVVNYLAKKGRKGKGTIVVFAAGNDGKKIIANSTEAALSSALVVSSNNSQFQRILSSSFGPSVDIMAFGGMARAASADGGYRWFNGTSLSAAIASGVAALLLSQEPELTADQVTEKLSRRLKPHGSKYIQDNKINER
ncbi:hypothetical protein DI392_10630 [Vibrio albus]|uniref:Peptidase S8/S53 domain-containing protein n=1 Tax=Vibrio albus TaxID=2200953 RepID=A0A2U3B945_9VIBR|nr:S8/S53 family peptidase [Vibrio albus]PWI33303.1 hypothetical protein DI392_10630 [Vibrio albus]